MGNWDTSNPSATLHDSDGQPVPVVYFDDCHYCPYCFDEEEDD